MHLGCDIDGAADLDPAIMGSLLMALRAAGHRVSILTGCSNEQPTQQDAGEKADYLRSIGLGNAWDKLVVFGDPPHKAKARWIRDNHVDLFIDNSIENAQRAARYCTVLVPWNSADPEKARRSAEREATKSSPPHGG